LKNKHYQLDAIALTDPGRMRALNEDNLAVDTEYGFAVVADGMGGHNAGEVASRITVDTLTERLPVKIEHFRAGARQPSPAQFAEQLIGEANRAIMTVSQRQTDCQGMGTTLALLLLHGECVSLLHVGDSRIYRLRDGKLQQLTRDDSLLHDQIELGLISAEEAATSHNRHFVTGALGRSNNLTIHIREEDVLAGDLFLLCTDGLTDLVNDSDIELIIDQLNCNLPLAAEHLVQLANDNGGTDNISVVLARVVSRPGSEGRGLLARILGWLGL
jgi:protein phosphatase